MRDSVAPVKVGNVGAEPGPLTKGTTPIIARGTAEVARVFNCPLTLTMASVTDGALSTE